MRAALTAVLAGLACGTALAQQANVNLDYNPQRNLFVGQGTEEAKGRMGQRCVALHEALLKHGVEHEHYVGGHGGHDWSTWRHLVHERFLPGLWRPALLRNQPPNDEVCLIDGEWRRGPVPSA